MMPRAPHILLGLFFAVALTGACGDSGDADAPSSSSAPSGDAGSDGVGDGDGSGGTPGGSGGSTRAPTCDGIDCSGHGTCSTTDPEVAHCVCESGYAAQGLTCLELGGEGIVLEANRLSGVAPLAIYLDATGTSCGGADCEAFHDLHFKWDFGDPASGT